MRAPFVGVAGGVEREREGEGERVEWGEAGQARAGQGCVCLPLQGTRPRRRFTSHIRKTPQTPGSAAMSAISPHSLFQTLSVFLRPCLYLLLDIRDLREKCQARTPAFLIFYISEAFLPERGNLLTFE